MTTVFSEASAARTSAKIIPFPLRGRRTADHHDETKLEADLRSPRVLGDTIGSAWYHEAAIQESKRAGER